MSIEPLAADGPPAVKLAAPTITDEDRERVCEALCDPGIAYGPVVDAFEGAVASALDRDHGVATISGTAALHLALLAVGVEPGDLVLMPTLTFAAPAHAVRYVGAEPLLFDVEPLYRQLDMERLAEWLGSECDLAGGRAVHRASGRPIGAALPVDLLGHPCDVTALKRATEPLGIPIIEDAAQALGARRRGRPMGHGANVVCLSFNANKMITTGGGGMLVADDEDVIERARLLANQAKDEGIEYIHREVGFNYRLPSAQAALGLSQLDRLDQTLADKQQITDRYIEGLGDIPGLMMPREAPWAEAANWLFTMHVDRSEFGLDSRSLIKALGERDIETRPIFTPLHQEGAYEEGEAHECGTAVGLAATGVSLPSSIALEDDDLSRVVEAVLDAR